MTLPIHRPLLTDSNIQFTQAAILSSAAQIPAFALPSLLDGYGAMLAPSPLQPHAFVPPFLSMPAPSAVFDSMAQLAGPGYAAKQKIDLAPPSEAFARASHPDRRDAALMEAFLKSDPIARHHFEHAIGGRIVDFGSHDDGRFTIERFPAATRAASGPLASLYSQMDRAGGAGSNPFLGLTLGGLTGIASQLGAQGFDGFSSGVQGFPLFGVGAASWNPLAQPGKINGSNAPREGAHTAQVHSVLNDPSLTMEDKIMLTMMLICSKMDDDIKRQTEYINNLQNQQGNRGKTGKAGNLLGGLAGAALGGPIGAMIGGNVGGKVGGGGKQDGEKTIDLETKKLERMMTKRANLFDTLSKVMERYDQSAKNVIQSMRG